MNKWFVYIVQCSDGTLYTGITTDVEKRIAKHNSGKGAKYTRTRLPVVCLYTQEFENKSLASKEEWRIKQLKKSEKENIINEQEQQENYMLEEDWRKRMNNMYTYDDDSFCDGFTKY